MIGDEGLTSGQKAFLGALTPALIFVPIVLVLAMLRTNESFLSLPVAKLDDPLVRLFWGLILFSILAAIGFVFATINRRRTSARRGQVHSHSY